MSNYYKITKHPKTEKFAKAAWIEIGKYRYVVFPDGAWYHENYRKWEFQDSDETVTLEQKQALIADAVHIANGDES
jgi:hypothetical protein